MFHGREKFSHDLLQVLNRLVDDNNAKVRQSIAYGMHEVIIVLYVHMYIRIYAYVYICTYNMLFVIVRVCMCSVHAYTYVTGFGKPAMYVVRNINILIKLAVLY